jgi:peptidoglycan/LPS O-acetylase OafA/YrhL
MGLCKFAGRISYPIYMTHFPFLYVWMNFVANDYPTQEMLVVIGLALVPFLIAVAWASYTFWDEPIRARFSYRTWQSSLIRTGHKFDAGLSPGFPPVQQTTHKSPFGCPSPPPNFRRSFIGFHGSACLPLSGRSK